MPSKNHNSVIQFEVDQDHAPACQERDILDLERWRLQLRSRRLLGRDPERYDGLGYGNLSARMPDGTVIITGSQTGHLPSLGPAHYARILDFDPERNWVRSRGLVKPSSETMTHLAIYQSAASVKFVFHTHYPELWHAGKALELPMTDARAECGTIGLFYSVLKLLEEEAFCRRRILAIGGHEDGIMSWGETADEAGLALAIAV